MTSVAKNLLLLSVLLVLTTDHILLFPLQVSAEENCHCHAGSSDHADRYSLNFPADEPIQSGSLLFHRGDCLAVKIYTRSPYTHVGVIIDGEEGWSIFDSANGTGTRKQLLTKYLAECAAEEVVFYHPEKPLSAIQLQRLSAFLSDNLGRPYSISQFVSGKQGTGIHCSEYATEALISAGIVAAKQPCRVSPASLLEGITESQLYSPGKCLQAAAAELNLPAEASYCTRFWLQTKDYTSRCCRKLSRMFFCRG